MDKLREKFNVWFNKYNFAGRAWNECMFDAWQAASQESAPVANELPPLPAMRLTITDEPGAGHYYTADQMREYGRACAAQALAAGARDKLDAELEAAFEFAASTIELFDDKTMEGDYMLDASECAGIIRALKPSAIAAMIQQGGSDA